jgi:digeranylgeranylglycerophospholipid reductase
LAHDFYDVIVVGAGPAGSYTAYGLSSRGFKVAVLEQKEAPGIDTCCTGIVSAECFDSFGVAPGVILSRARSAKLFSPSGNSLRLEKKGIQAYIVDRASFDRAIAAKAMAEGAVYFFSLPATNVVIDSDGIQVETPHLVFKARAVVIAAGFKPGFTRKLGLGSIDHFAMGAQTVVEVQDVEEVEIYFSQEMTPGFFGWLVPVSNDEALAGVFATSHAEFYLEKLLSSPFCREKIVRRDTEIKKRAIPLKTLPRTFRNRLLVIGDAAGQVKTTTGGGIYFGNLGSQAAVEVLSEALDTENLGAKQLSRYQRAWKTKMGREIHVGYMARRLYGKLSDSQIERIFDIVSSNNITRDLLNSPSFSFDWHGNLILAFMKSVWNYLPDKISSVFRREIDSINISGRQGA